MNYPETWFDLKNGGAPDTQKSFSNEDVGAPLMMDAKGAWITVSIYPGARSCSGRTASPPPTHRDLVIDGEPAVQYAGATGSVTLVEHQGWCYEVGFIAYNSQTRNQEATVADNILASFRFNR